MARYLVTGGCGFVGSHLTDALLAAGHSVSILDDLSTGKMENVAAAADVEIGDVADHTVVDRMMADVDGCFHLAAVASVDRSREAWAQTHRTNLTGTINILNAARAGADRSQIPVVYVSSAAVYGDNPETPLQESAATTPLSAYGADKLGCEMHARVGHTVHGVPSIGLRPFNIYGPRQDPTSPYSGVISLFARRLSTGERVTVFGDGEQVRDFVYVGDVVRFLVAAMASAPTGVDVFNICTGRSTSVNVLAQTIADICGVPAQIDYGPARVGDIRVSLGDPTKAATVLGVTADTDLHSGLRRTLAWTAE